jgi:ABC-type multidrug transport system fused ATPase/permease subunit
MLIRAVYSVLGALVLLAFYDGLLVPLCLALLVPAVFLNRVYARRTRQLSAQLHDEIENEVDAIAANDAAGVRRHYGNVACWRIKLSDCEALNFGVMELFVLGVLVAALLRACSLPSAQAGDIFAVFRYVLMLIMGLDSVPKLVQQFSRLRDIHSRIQPPFVPSAAARYKS